MTEKSILKDKYLMNNARGDKIMNIAMIKKDWKINKAVYMIVFPVIVHIIIFSYAPMVGVLMAFQNYNIKDGIFGSPWVGFKHFADFFNSYYFLRLLRNTFLLSFYDLVFGFPAPILFALLLNEIRNQKFKRVVQTISYMPHFISTVIVAGIIIDFFSSTGAIAEIIAKLGGPTGNLLGMPRYFRTIFITSGIWQGLGFGSIIYIASLSKIDPELYEAADIDGAGRLKKAIYITLPSIAPTIIIMLILRIGNLLTVNSEKILLLYSPTTYSVADVIGTFVYRKGLVEYNYGYSTAVGLFNSIVNFTLLIVANFFSKKFSETSLF